MGKSIGFVVLLLAVAALLTVISVAASAQFGKTMKDAPEASSNFQQVPPLPTCTTVAVQNGDPSKGAAVLLSKSSSGCVIPWHWHSANESLMFVNGNAKLEMKGGGVTEAKTGEYVYLPAKQAHQFTCSGDCEFFISTDGKFDLHYVDSTGKEISPEQALKAANEKPAVEAKK